MKKILILLLLPFIFSCEKDEILEPIDNFGPIQTRGIADFDPLTELRGIPINIRLYNPGASYIYLSTSLKTLDVDLFNRDDGTLRQRWELKSGSSGTLCSFAITGGTPANNTIFNASGTYPNIKPSIGGLQPNLYFDNISGTSRYYIRNRAIITPPIGPYKELYLHSSSHNSKEIKFSEKNNTGGRDIWEIVPIGSYVVTDMKYAYESDDYIIPRPYIYKIIDIPNSTNPNPVSQTFEFTEQISETSSFSQTQGVNTTNSISSNNTVNMPDIGSGSLNTTTTMNSTFTFQQTLSQSRSRAFKIEFKTDIPPYSNGKINIKITKYQSQLTYVATVKSVSGQTFKVKGKWKGELVTGFTYEPIITYP